MAKDKTGQPLPGGKTEPQELARAVINRELIKADNFVSIYANDTQLELSPWDVRLTFGVIDEVATTDKQTNTVTQFGEVRMSLPHAKRVAQILVAQINHYEELTKSLIPVPE